MYILNSKSAVHPLASRERRNRAILSSGARKWRCQVHALEGAFRAPARGGSSAWERAGVWCWRAQHVRHVSRGLYSSSFRRFLLAPDAPARRRERSALSRNMDHVIPTPLGPFLMIFLTLRFAPEMAPFARSHYALFKSARISEKDQRSQKL